MVQDTSNLNNLIKKSRTTIKQISIKSYLTSLRSLYKRLNPEDDLKTELKTDFLKDKVKVMEDINKQKINTKKNILTSILVALSSNTQKDEKLIDFYQLKLKELNEKYISFLEKQEKTETQEKNWIDYNTFIKVINELLNTVKNEDIQKKDKLTRAEYVLLQKYVILSFYQVYPLRNDVADMKVISQKEYDSLKDKKNNYFVKDDKNYKIVLNAFKNVSRIGSKVFVLPLKLVKIVKLWLKHNTSGYLFTLNNGRDPLTPNGITKLLNSIFKKACDGKKISTSMLRHINISQKLKNEPTIQEKKTEEKKTEDVYMHSASMNQLYRKI